MKHDVFVSYSSKDKTIADAVVAALENQSFRCWYAPRDIKPSADWGDSITEAINACKIVLLIFSGSSNQSQRVRDEIYYAIAEEKVILPFRIENLDPTGSMRLHLSSRHWLDAFQPSWRSHLERLVDSVADSMGRAPAQPSRQEKTPAPVFHPEKKEGKKTPWLWVGLAVAAVAALSVAGVLWLGRQNDKQESQPTQIAAAVSEPADVEVATSPEPQTTVPAQAVNYPRNGHSYLYVDLSVSWRRARDYCADRGGYLATVQDAAENVFIFSLSNGGSWLGATDEEEEGAWEWLSGEPWDYTNWGMFNPDNWQEEEHYLGLGSSSEIAPTQWNDSKEDTMPFVCEWGPVDSASETGGKKIVVTSAKDMGPGSLRWALQDALPGDTILFDPVVFPLHHPTAIILKSNLRPINTDHITLDASEAGVILDGSQVGSEWAAGFEVNSEFNVIKGFEIVRFSGPGIILNLDARFNIIGGDRDVGLIPLGEGNLIAETSDGIAVMGSDNIITGNLIGTDSTGMERMGNLAPGIFLEENASNNLIGPNNTIAFNGTEGGGGIEIRSRNALGNIITANRIYNNTGPGISYNINEAPSFTYSTPPVILYADLETGNVHGQTCVGCLVEIFSTDTEDGKIYEGTAWTDDYGYFHFVADRPLAGPYLTATSRLSGENTSEFSLVSSARSEIQIALNTIRNEAPFYQTGFDTGELDDSNGNARVEDGRLIVTSEGDHTGVTLTQLRSEQFAVEFEFRFRDAEEGAHCIFETGDEDGGEDDYKALSYGFFPNGQANPSHHVGSGMHEDFAVSFYDKTITNTVTLIILGDQIAAFINGQDAWSVFNPDGRVVYMHQALSANGGIVCEYDNYKLWDLSEVNIQ